MSSRFERPASIAFRRFRVLPHRRELLLNDQPVRLGGRAFDVLIALIEAHGGVVAKEALIARVWQGQVVEENNLEVQISALRAAFGNDRDLIRTVSGRGYRFTGEIRFLNQDAPEPASGEPAVPPANSTRPQTNLPAPASELIGRDDELRDLVSLATGHRLVTLIGPGGIGKTRLALESARRLLPDFADGVWLAEFSSLTDPGLVPATVATALGLDVGAAEVSVQRVAQALADRRLLLVLDNCEHLIDGVAAMAEAALGAGSGLRIIATSREPLRIEGEQIYPIPPLAVPAAGGEDFWEYGAVLLFSARSRAGGARISRDSHAAAAIAAICRRLDGIPLAIELAAARAAALGVEELAIRLGDCFNLLTRGQRSAPPRHQTLRATFDWSYGLLAEPERVLLRRLAIFAGPFSLDAARAVGAIPELATSAVIEEIFSLIEKSLVVAEVEPRIARYRLLDTTRAYALEKLGESGELPAVAQRHAEYYRDLFERAETEWETRPASEWLAEYAWRIDNLRAALDWAFSAGGDASLAVELTAAAVPLWMLLSLVDECRGRVERALAALEADATFDARLEMKLRAAFGTSLTHSRGAIPEIGVVWTRALEIAESLGDREYQLQSLWGLWFFHNANGRHRSGLALAQRFCAVAARRPDSTDRLVGERLLGVSHHMLGNEADARRHLKRVLRDYVAARHRPHLIRYQLDLRVMARTMLARILWVQGLPEQAMRAVETAIDDARAAGHATSLCYALGVAACPIALAIGDLAAAEDYVRMLLHHATGHALAHWRAFGRSHQGVLAIQSGDVAAGLRLLRAGLEELRAAFSLITFMDAMAEALGRAGRIADGLAAIGEAIERSDRSEERWLIAELLRVKGELLLLRGAPEAAVAAEDHFRQALDWARRQGALSWELRAATSLARVLHDQGRSGEGAAALQLVYDRFTEGFDTADLKAAKALLQMIAP